MNEEEKAGWLADKIHAHDDYTKEAAHLLVKQAERIAKLEAALDKSEDLLQVLDGVNLEDLILPARYTLIKTRENALRAFINNAKMLEMQ